MPYFEDRIDEAVEDAFREIDVLVRARTPAERLEAARALREVAEYLRRLAEGDGARSLFNTLANECELLEVGGAPAVNERVWRDYQLQLHPMRAGVPREVETSRSAQGQLHVTVTRPNGDRVMYDFGLAGIDITEDRYGDGICISCPEFEAVLAIAANVLATEGPRSLYAPFAVKRSPFKATK